MKYMKVINNNKYNNIMKNYEKITKIFVNSHYKNNINYRKLMITNLINKNILEPIVNFKNI